MILTGHQPNYLPYLGFFHKIAQADVFAIVDNVQFVKRGTFGWMNRNRIRTKDGWVWLTVPVLTKGKFHQLIIDTRINNDIKWQNKHWQGICLNYHRAPFFKNYSDFFQDIYQNKIWESFSDLSETIIRYIIDSLGIKIRIAKCSQICVQGKGTDFVIDMCKKIGADTYLSGIHGRDYLDKTKFEENGIKLIFQDFVHPTYKQQYSGFIPGLSIIDLLFNYGPESLDIILGNKKVGV